MWKPESLEKLIPYAEEALARNRKSPSNILTYARFSIDQDIDRQLWREYSEGERAFYCLFWLAYNRQDMLALRCICPPEHYARLSFLMVQRVEAYKRELTRSASTVVAELRLRAFKKAQTKNKTKTPRQVGWAAEDVTAEYFDGETEVEPYRKPRPIVVPEQDIPPSPVRKVSVEEYYATRKNPLPKGVALEFDKTSPLWLKLDDRYADKSMEGDEEPSWYKEKD